MGSRDEMYVTLRSKLDNLGYNQPLSVESVPLVDALLNELCLANERTTRAKEITNETLEKFQRLQTTVRPLQKDFGRIVNENNHLRREISQTNKKYEQKLKGLREQISELESNYSDLEVANLELIRKIGSLEELILEQNEKLSKYESLPKDIFKNTSSILLMKNALAGINLMDQGNNDGSTPLNTISSINNYISDVIAHKTPNELTQEIDKLKMERTHLASTIEFYRKRLKARDEEIVRLTEQPGKTPSTTNVPQCLCHVLQTDDDYYFSPNIAEKFAEINQKLQVSMKNTVKLAEKIKKLEQKQEQEKQFELPFPKESICICDQICKLQEMFNGCKCETANFQSSAESRLKLKVMELFNALDGMSRENEDLKRELDLLKTKGCNDHRLLQVEIDELRYKYSNLLKELRLLLNEEHELTDISMALQHAIDSFKELNITSDPNSCAPSENASLPVPQENFSESGERCRSIADFKIVSNKFNAQKCCEDVQKELMSLRNENIALNKLNNSLRKSIEQLKTDTGSAAGSKPKGSRAESSIASKSPSQNKTGDHKKSSNKPYKVSFRAPSTSTSEESMEKNSTSGKTQTDAQSGAEPCTSNFPTATDWRSETDETMQTILFEMEQLRHERDYYCKECCLLQDKLLQNVQSNTAFNERTRSSNRAEVTDLQDRVAYLQQEIIVLQQALQFEKNQNQMSNMKFQDTVKFYESEKHNILCRQEEMANRVQFLEGTTDSLNKEMQNMLAERSYYQAEYNKLRSVNEHLELSKKNFEALTKKIDQELNNALQHIKTLELEKNDLVSALSSANQEIQSKNEKLLIVVKEKDHLLEKLDNQTIELHKLDQEKRQQICLINQLEQNISRLNCQALRSNTEESRAEREIINLKHDLQGSLSQRNKLLAENRSLQSDLASLVKDNKLKCQEIDKHEKEILKLKEQLQNYVEEVRRVEQILESKEIERQEMLDQFKTLSAEAMNLESSNQTLESENTNLRKFQEKLNEIQTHTKHSDSLVLRLEEEVMTISSKYSSVKHELETLKLENANLKEELETSKSVIRSMEHSKQMFEGDVHLLEEQIDQANAGMAESHTLKHVLTSQLEEQQNLISSLQDAVSASRKEAYEQSLQNYDTQQKVDELETTVSELRDKLTIANNALLKCEETCDEYKEENTNLKRELLNEKFRNVKAEETPSFSTSL